MGGGTESIVFPREVHITNDNFLRENPRAGRWEGRGAIFVREMFR